MTDLIDLAAAPGPDDSSRLVLHTATCPEVRKLASAGVPVLTMFGCERSRIRRWQWHDCLKEVAP